MAPEDPLGTVRAGDGTLAVRARTVQPEAGDDLSWFIIDIGGDLAERVDADEIEDRISTWPIVYQPDALAVVNMAGDVVALYPDD